MAEKKFTLYWRYGERQVITGETIEAAFTAAGYGAGAIHALDWYDNGETHTHFYSKNKKAWVRKVPFFPGKEL